ncbi:MAG: ATP-binding protein [Nitrospirae bacterium]|nr:ATP-binding protein [Nitrospirota bacterium]
MKFRYNPFDGRLSDVLSSDLGKLYSVSEGWYVEYKSQAIPVKTLAKSLSAFANQYGGWLVLGVKEDPDSHTAKSFPGIVEEEVPHLIQRLREASKDVLNPEVYFETREFKGPVDEVQLISGRSIVVVRIPPGSETPYIHADGRVYRRVADSSDPKPETDRSIIDRLWARGEKARARLESFVTRSPLTAKSEENNSYLHLSIFSDPYEVRGDLFNGGFHEFSAIMRKNSIPINSIFTRSGGFIARQTGSIDPYYRNFTWEFDLRCHSFVTLPIHTYSQPYSQCLTEYQYGNDYNKLIERAQLTSARLLDLNIMLDGIAAIVERHRILAKHAGVNGPFYVKAHLENVWRTVPFLDMPFFTKHVDEYGVPVVQDKNILAPPGAGLESFIELSERDAVDRAEDTLDKELALRYVDAVIIAIRIFEALGVPALVLVKDEKAFLEMMLLGRKFMRAQQLRNAERDQ